MVKFCGVVWAFAACLLAGSVQAHPGGLNKEGCHNDRKNGGYHCHGGSSSRPPSSARSAPAPRASLAPSASGLSSGASGRVFRNCDEARAAGAAPVRRGDPGYGPHLDRDNDGVGCEPYRNPR